MNKNKVELQVLSVSYSQEQAGAYALLLGEVNGPRKMPVIIGTAEAQAILLEIRGIRSPRPLTHELFASVLGVLGAHLLRVLIYKVENGLFYSYLYLQSGNNIIRVDSRTSDAVAMAMRMQCPILVYEDILDAERMKTDEEEEEERKPDAKDRKTTIGSMQKELDKAIEQEDYEKAAALRDMIKHLKDSE